MENLLNLAGKNAFVTGASSGLGAHFAKILARAGANVVIAARRRESLDAVAADIAAAVGACRAIALDISSADSIAAAASEIEAADLLVNNAGIARDAPFLDHLESDWDDVLATTVKGMRSEERRVGKECGSPCRYRWAPYHSKKNKKNNNH